MSGEHGVLIIYTGGTIGSVPEDARDPLSPLVPADIDTVIKWLPRYDDLDRKITFGRKQVRIGTHSWNEPLDSSNIAARDWREMAEVIRSNYAKYDGFVILHGTDTMAYTSSALSFMLDHLRKPVVITGSQLPIGETRSDAVQNLVTAIEIAAAACLGREPVPEVTVFFRDDLLRGCRTTKDSASSFAGFSSPNLPTLGRAGEHLVMTPQSLPLVSSQHHLRVADRLEEGIAALIIFPGMSAVLLEAMLMAEGLRGVVLLTFGAGNAPSTELFLAAIQRAIDAGRLIVDVTQCLEGEAELGRYEVSAGMMELGVVSGMDMTCEAALTKLAVVLGEESDIDIAADRMQVNLRGEQRQSKFHLHFGPGEVDEQPVELAALRPMVEGDRYRAHTLERAAVQIVGMTMDARRGDIRLDVYIDPPIGADGQPELEREDKNPHYLGSCKKRWDGEGTGTAFVEATSKLGQFVDGKRTPRLYVVSDSPGMVSWGAISIGLYADC